MARPYILPNRKAFADAVARIFLKYPPTPTTREEKDEDVCLTRGKGNVRELLPHQKIVRDYLSAETPYRGLLLYHGLGSGKTCSSIAVAESLLSRKKIYVMLPASLEENYRVELRKCGDPLYAFDQHWSERTLNDETMAIAKQLGISDKFLQKKKKFFTTDPAKEPNYKSLSVPVKLLIGEQIEDIINQRFTFIRYNGLSTANIEKYAPAEGPNPYDGSVVIIDEVHNFISRITNSSDIARRLYNAIYEAKDCRVVALSGTPVINRAHEIAFLMNLLRGPIERIIVPVKAIPVWDEERMTTALRALPDVDTVEYDTPKKLIMVTRNPPNFRSIYNDKGDRIAVQYMKDMKFVASPIDWVRSWATKFGTDVGGAELSIDRVTVQKLECLPTDIDEFGNLFLDGLLIKNPLLLQRRIQGLVSYFKGADERMLPKRIDDDKMLEKVEMSDEQFNQYLMTRSEEMKANKQRSTPRSGDDEMKSFRVKSRLACNYAIPPDLRASPEDDRESTEDDVPEKEGILEKLRANPDRFLTERALETFSPKLLRLLKNIQGSMGPAADLRNQFVYSQYKSIEGIGILTAILDAHGWQAYKLTRENNQWIEDPSMDPNKPAYALFVGGSGMVGEDVKSEREGERATGIKRSLVNVEQRELMRQIFNGDMSSDTFPSSLRMSVESKGKKKLCLFMASSSGAEGITLLNVRHVHIMEPHWNPARHDQVIGRAIRLCSHATLPQEERTVRVSFYLSVFTKAQATSTEGASNVVPIRRADTFTKRYEGEPTETFMTTDEYLYEMSYEKDVTNKRISTLLKQAAIDCEIHRKFHSRETPVISCMRFDSGVGGEDLAFNPNIKMDDRDVSYLRNMVKKHRNLQKVQIKGMVFLIDPDTKEVYDGPAFEDERRLLRVGYITAPTRIDWILP